MDASHLGGISQRELRQKATSYKIYMPTPPQKKSLKRHAKLHLASNDVTSNGGHPFHMILAT